MTVRWSTALNGRQIESGELASSGPIAEVGVPVVFADGSVLEVKVHFDPPVAAPASG